MNEESFEGKNRSLGIYEFDFYEKSINFTSNFAGSFFKLIAYFHSQTKFLYMKKLLLLLAASLTFLSCKTSVKERWDYFPDKVALSE